MQRGVRILIVAAALLGVLLWPVGADAITSEELAEVPLRDDLERSDPPSGFSSSGIGAGKWSKPNYGAISIGGAYNSGGRLGYGSPEGVAVAYWNAQVFEDNGSGVAVVATLNSKLNNGEGVALWLNQPSPSTVLSGYQLLIAGGPSGGEGTAYLYKWTNGSSKLLASGAALIGTGLAYALAEKSGELTAWVRVGNSFINPPWFKVTDATPFKSGYAGLEAVGTSPSLARFSAAALPPNPPSVTSSNPASPGSSTTPSIKGSAEAATTVRLYSNSSCSGAPIGSAGAATFASSGISASVAKESTTSFYATATNSEERTSTCSTTSVTYVNDSTPPAKPTLSWTDPASPGAKTAIHVGGSAETATTIKLYKGETCSGSPEQTGTAAQLALPGLAVTVSKNTTSTFSATATDAAGNISPCSSSITYVEASSEILFEAQHLGDFSSIEECISESTTEVPDPLGSGRKVLNFTVYDTDITPIGEPTACPHKPPPPTENPRAQALSPALIEPGTEFWLRTKFLIPAAFPSIPNWMSLVSLYGPPFGGPSPWRVEVDSNKFKYIRNATYGEDLAWVAPLIKGEWVEVMTHERFAKEGWLEFWLNGSQVTFFGPETSKTIPETKKLAMQTADASNNGGPNSFRIAQYRKAGMIKEGASIYFQFIKVGTSKASVGG